MNDDDTNRSLGRRLDELERRLTQQARATVALGSLVNDLDAEAAALRLIARALAQRLALGTNDPLKYAAEIFAAVTALPDAIELKAASGKHAIARRAAIRRSVDKFAGEMARDLGAKEEG